MRASSSAKQSGFTLIEIVMVMMIFSILTVVLSRLLYHGYQAFTVANSINQTDTQTLIGIERVAYDLRNATSITTIGANSFTFVDTTGTSYAYSLSGSNLMRGSYTLADSVTSFTLAYWDLDGSVTAVPAAVEYVNISLSLNSDNTPVNLTTTVALRGSDQ